MTRIVEATSAQQIAQVAGLLEEFRTWQETRYGAGSWLLEAYFDPAEWQAELADLGLTYGPPGGGLLLALEADQPAGCVGLRALAVGGGEVKRLYVAKAYRGRGLAKDLMARLIDLARARGHQVLRLDTGDRQHEAVTLYRALGFRETGPYTEMPKALRERMLFMELAL